MSNGHKLKYKGFVPPCGIFCGRYPNFIRPNNRCEGAEAGCKTRKCKGIYVCCIEMKGLEFCYQCANYPCSRFKKFADIWLKHGQNLLENQEFIKNCGKEDFMNKMNKNERYLTV
jgi:hypothetical protein